MTDNIKTMTDSIKSKRFAYVEGQEPREDALDNGLAARRIIEAARQFPSNKKAREISELEAKLGALAALEERDASAECGETRQQMSDLMQMMDADIESACSQLANCEQAHPAVSGDVDSVMEMINQLNKIFESCDSDEDSVRGDTAWHAERERSASSGGGKNGSGQTRVANFAHWCLGAWPRDPQLWGWFALQKNDGLAWVKILKRAEAAPGFDAEILRAALESEDRGFALAWEKRLGDAGDRLAALISENDIEKALAFAAWHAIPGLSEDLSERLRSHEPCGAKLAALDIDVDDTPLLCMVKGAASRKEAREACGLQQAQDEENDEISCVRGLAKHCDARRGVASLTHLRQGPHDAAFVTTPLILAARTGCARIAQELLPFSDERASDGVGTALMRAAMNGDAAMVKLLANLRSAAVPDKEFRRAISFACEKGFDDSVAILAPLSDLIVGDEHGNNALCVAIRAKQWSSALLVCNRESARRINDAHECPLTLLLARSSKEALEAEAGGNSDDIDARRAARERLLERLLSFASAKSLRLRQRPFMEAINQGQSRAAMTLSQGMSLFYPIRGGASAIELAMLAGGSVEKDFFNDDRSSPPEELDVGRLVGLAIKLGKDQWIERLLSKGNPCQGGVCCPEMTGSNATDAQRRSEEPEENMTPLMLAAIQNRPDLIRLLATKDNIHEARGSEARTAMSLAMNNGCMEALEAIEEAQERFGVPLEEMEESFQCQTGALSRALISGSEVKIRLILEKRNWLPCAWSNVESRDEIESAFHKLGHEKIIVALKILGPLPEAAYASRQNRRPTGSKEVGFVRRNSFSFFEIFTAEAFSEEALRLLLGERGLAGEEHEFHTSPLIKACELVSSKNWTTQKSLIRYLATKVDVDIQDAGGETALMRFFRSASDHGELSNISEVFQCLLERCNLDMRDYLGRSILERANRLLPKEHLLLFTQMELAERERRALNEAVAPSAGKSRAKTAL